MTSYEELGRPDHRPAGFDLRAPWRLLRRRRDLRLLVTASLVSLSGDWILGIGLAYAVYDLTGSTLASTGTLLAGLLPQVLAGPLAGVLVDRWDRRRTMIATNLAMAVGLLPLLLVTGADRVGLVYAVLVGQSLLEVFFAPAEQAMLPRLVDEDELVTANAVNGQARNLARLLGGALGGTAAAVGGVPAVAALDVLTFLAAALLLRAIRTSGRVERRSTEAAEAAVQRRLTALRDELRGGIRAASREPAIRVLLVFLLVTSAGEGIMGTLFAPFVRDVLQGSGQAYGVICAVQAVGGLLGGLVVAGLAHRLSPLALLGAGSVLFGLVDLAIFLYPTAYVAIWPAVLGMVVVGIPGAGAAAGQMTIFQQHTSDAERGRVFSLVALAQTTAGVAGTVAAGLLGESIGIVPVLAFQGVGYVVAGTYVTLALRGDRSGRPQGAVDESSPASSGCDDSQAPRM
ncbi:MFS transporter [Nocardioides sp. KIGAM211]|uniref:MFS transporter n=1 Tax=Nocardioides luti TaxID=2761101 RepID=A0A7X0RDP0_9ACTN|nr:MFS transporter [Nocardioides luti]MBB6626361.1 MFS transporter [Nocardioides luti]